MHTKEFYYTETQSGTQYQQRASGKPDISRLIHGHADYWFSPSAPREKKKKKLILADWSAGGWSEDKIREVCAALERLLDEGFEIYLWQDNEKTGQLKPLTKDTLPWLEDPAARGRMFSSDVNILKKITTACATQYRFTSDAVQVLDDYWINHLLSGDAILKPRSISLSDFSNFRGLEANIIRWLQHSKPSPTILNIDVFSPATLRAKNGLCVQFPELMKHIGYRHVVLEIHTIAQFLRKRAVSLADATLKLSDLAYIETLVLKAEFGDNMSMPSSELQGILLASSRLKKLSLVYVKLNGSLLLAPGNTPALQELDTTDSELGTTNLKNLLMAASHLKVLNLSGNTNTSAPLTIEPASLPALDTLKFTFSDSINLANLNALLLAAPNLKKLDLSFSEHFSHTITLAPKSLPALQEIYLSNSHITSMNIINLLQAAHHLKVLDLSRCINVNSITILERNSLSQLEKLKLFETTANLKTFLLAAPNLKELTLGEMTLNDSDIESESLRHLEKLYLDYIDISPISFKNLLEALPNLKELHVTALSLNPIALTKNSLLQLEELQIENSDITCDNLLLLLAAAPNLKRIRLHGCSQIPVKIQAAAQADANSVRLQELLALLTTEEREAPRHEASSPERQAFRSNGQIVPAPSAKVHNASGSELWDADTTLDPGIKFHVTRVFYPIGPTALPPVNNYRLDIFHTVSTNPISCGLRDAFTLSKTGDLNLEPCNITKLAHEAETLAATADGQLFYGKQTLHLTTEWQAMASLSAQEVMKRYHTTPDAMVEIQYSSRDNLYYIRSDKTQTVDVDFTLYVPDAKPTLPADIKTLVDKFLSYTAGELALPTAAPTGNDYLDAILEQKKGACRHRAFAFKAEMTRLYPDIPVRLITNDCHALIEVKINNQWLACDLGGYPARLEIDERHRPNREDHEALETHIVLPSPTSPIPTTPTSPDLLVTDFKEALQTWVKARTLTGTTQEYAQACISPDIKKRLIECASSEDVDAMHFILQKYCRITHRPVFYVNSPDDLICSAPSMQKRGDNTGALLPGPGGPLHDFLSQNANGILIVNYDAFNADDLVRFNALVDKERKADGTDVPVDTIIIGLLNANSLKPLPGNDFYSRFDRVETCPLSSRQLAAEIPSLPPEAPADIPAGAAAHYAVLNLYHAMDWEAMLLGRFVPEGGTWRYEEGALQRALKEGATTIEVQNGLWENKDFRRFWQEAFESGVIHYPGGTLNIPPDVSFVQRDGYDWTLFTPYLQQEERLSDSHHVVLNPATLGDFFNQYQVTDDKQLQRVDGFIAAAKDKTPATLAVHVTHAISDDHWAMLLAACRAQNVNLAVYCAPGVELPKPLRREEIETAAVAEPIMGLPDAASTAAIIQSTDVDITVAELVGASPDALVIDISECQGTDLISRMNGELINREGEPLHFQFEKITCAVTNALGRNQPVILKGFCSGALAQELAPILLESPNIKIVSEDTTAFHYMPRYIHTVSKEEKLAFLRRDYSALIEDLEPYIDKEPLSVLISRCRFIQAGRGDSSDEAWLGLYHLPASTKDPGIFNELTSEAAAEAFTQNRIKAVNAVLMTEPHVFLTGLSGVGKSTFVMREFCQAGDTLYQDESNLAAWAADQTPNKRKLLFLDEANLSQSDWSAFEGLFNQPPGILINGQYYPLTDQHKVIFAGNPLSYGDERKLAPFFKRHGNTVVFDPLPGAVLYERVLKPVFKDTLLESQAAIISTQLLDVYRFLCQCSDTDILISPRELQMMALLTVSYCSRRNSNAAEVAKYFAYHLAKHLVPAAKQDEFARLFKPHENLVPARTPRETDYLITPSREHVNQLLDEYLNLHEIRADSTNEVQRYGGLGGLILDGEPGIGKSDMVLTALIARGYQEVHSLTQPARVDKPFYRMPVSMPLADKEVLLLKAFHEGAVVIIDEINSSPMMERLLNALLMGSTPNGQRPEKPGFMVIGTQNPITMAGRRAPSTALSRRMTTLELPPYTAAEMYDILISKELPSDKATALVQAYQEQFDYAKANYLQPPPTFRDLLNLVEDIKRGRDIKAKRAQTPSTDLSSERSSSTQELPAPEDSVEALITAYFGPDPDALGGILNDYLRERGETYWFKDLCQSYAMLLFNSFGYKAESAIRKEKIIDLHTQAIAFHNDPLPETYAALCETINYCKQEFTPRALPGKPDYDKSLHAYLSEFERGIKQAIPQNHTSLGL